MILLFIALLPLFSVQQPVWVYSEWKKDNTSFYVAKFQDRQGYMKVTCALDNKEIKEFNVSIQDAWTPAMIGSEISVNIGDENIVSRSVENMEGVFNKNASTSILRKLFEYPDSIVISFVIDNHPRLVVPLTDSHEMLRRVLDKCLTWA